jgi:predicted histone-like DNA-binding protein
MQYTRDHEPIQLLSQNESLPFPQHHRVHPNFCEYDYTIRKCISIQSINGHSAHIYSPKPTFMSIYFKVIEKGQPGVPGGGEKKFYASAQSNGDLTLNGLARLIEKSSTVSRADIYAVLISMVDTMEEALANGQIIRMGDLGSMRVSLSSKGEETAQEVNSTSIKEAKVIFAPGKGIKQLMESLSFEKVN